MDKFFKRYLMVGMLFSCAFTQSVFANSPLKIAFGNSLPPWVFPDQDKGILVDLTRLSFLKTDYQIQAVYYPYARRIKAYKNGQVDVVTDMTPQVVAEEKLEGYLSLRFYYYENIAISLAEHKFVINNLDDLSSLRVLAWQGAINTLSPEYASMATANPLYKETHNQQSQIEMLYRKRTDVIQLDAQIFSYYRQKVALEGKVDTQISINYAPIFGRNYCAFLFRDKAVRDIFNEQIKRIQADEKQYQAIYDRYAN